VRDLAPTRWSQKYRDPKQYVAVNTEVNQPC
jgi:hypothetical protein